LPIKNTQYSVLQERHLTINFNIKFPVIVPDLFESSEDLSDYIYEDGILHSCHISSDIFKGEEWNIDRDGGCDLRALKLSERIYKKIPKFVQDFYSNSEMRFEYDSSI
jgi:hypothetical protein